MAENQLEAASASACIGDASTQKRMEWRGNPSHVVKILGADRIGHPKSRQSGIVHQF